MRTFPACHLAIAGILAIAAVGASSIGATHAAVPANAASTSAAATISLMPPRAAQTFTVGTLRVQRYGDLGRPVILIPGLECGPWEWAQTIRNMQGSHRIYAVTLAGFDGVPAPKDDPQAGNLLDRADASLLKLIQDHHIDKPVIIGHSIGGTLALRFAGEHAGLLSGVVAVDGLPIFPRMEKVSSEQRKAMAQGMKARIESMSPAQFKSYAMVYMTRVGVLDAKLAARTVPYLARSDVKAIAAYAAVDMSSDYRPLMQHADVPILEIVPYNPKDAAVVAQAMGTDAWSAADKIAYYRKLLADAPNLKLSSIAPAHHFVMLDQPQKFQATLNRFMAGLPEAGR